ncbi:RNA polymerase II transcription mediator complex subunit 9-domain-containing protein [Cercophora newfieldiana]|uniref:Mediator of RNA polymerase II transcription subunit 9 n=1 Tax=Cercophora newfieldiana TaxID=92897 RepID=A0AA39YBC9_9PEZI|nr:RNA polymerase II transcription mediator complex subunit 9-domain-containing protein [Cercophora newfieldiana]
MPTPTQTTTTTHLPPGLSPDSIDTLTELTTILTKLRASQTLLTTTAPSSGAVTGTTPLPSGPSHANNNFTVKELPAATDNLKHKLQRARAVVKTLPDVSRTLEQQEIEIRELEARRRDQLAMLGRIKAVGLEQGKGDDGERMVE